METPIRTDVLAAADAQSVVSWASIAAGAVVAAASSLGLLALGVGLGLSSVSPWTDFGVSASTFKNATGIYMVAVAVMASAMGGYLAARLRIRWIGVNTNEVFFRDTAHGLITWAFATVLSASVLGAALQLHRRSAIALRVAKRPIAADSGSARATVRVPQARDRQHRGAITCGEIQRHTCGFNGSAGRAGSPTVKLSLRPRPCATNRLRFSRHGEDQSHVARAARRASQPRFQAREREASPACPYQRPELGAIDALLDRFHAVALAVRAPRGDAPATG